MKIKHMTIRVTPHDLSPDMVLLDIRVDVESQQYGVQKMLDVDHFDTLFDRMATSALREIKHVSGIDKESKNG